MVLVRVYYYMSAISSIPSQSGVLTLKITVTVFSRKIQECFDPKIIEEDLWNLKLNVKCN